MRTGFATAAAIARGTGPSAGGEVVLTLGAHAGPNRAWPWPPALTGCCWLPTDQLADETAEFLNANARRLARAVIVGGEQAVAATVADHTADALVADG